MGKTRNIFAFVVVAIIGSIIFWKRDWIKEKLKVVQRPKTANESQQSAVVQAPISPSSPSSISTNDQYTFPLKLGSKGTTVKALQNALNRKYNAHLAEDGYFGPATESALVKAGFGKELETNEVVKIMI